MYPRTVIVAVVTSPKGAFVERRVVLPSRTSKTCVIFSLSRHRSNLLVRTSLSIAAHGHDGARYVVGRGQATTSPCLHHSRPINSVSRHNPARYRLSEKTRRNSAAMPPNARILSLGFVHPFAVYSSTNRSQNLLSFSRPFRGGSGYAGVQSVSFSFSSRAL